MYLVVLHSLIAGVVLQALLLRLVSRLVGQRVRLFATLLPLLRPGQLPA
jgi:hypothetical protein